MSIIDTNDIINMINLTDTSTRSLFHGICITLLVIFICFEAMAFLFISRDKTLHKANLTFTGISSVLFGSLSINFATHSHFPHNV